MNARTEAAQRRETGLVGLVGAPQWAYALGIVLSALLGLPRAALRWDGALLRAALDPGALLRAWRVAQAGRVVPGAAVYVSESGELAAEPAREPSFATDFEPFAAIPQNLPEQPVDAIWYGRHWEYTLPPGLPPGTRGTTPSLCEPFYQWLQRELRDYPELAVAARNMAWRESGCEAGRPANRYDTRPPERRPEGAPYVSAWGFWQANRDAWRGYWADRSYGGGETEYRPTSYPWEATPTEEIMVPLRAYVRAYRIGLDHVTTDGVTGLPMALMAFELRHSKPGWLSELLRGQRTYESIPAKYQQRVQRALAHELQRSR